MTWEWFLIFGAVYFVVHAIGAVEHHVKQSAESLVEIAGTLEEIQRRVGNCEDDLSKIRGHVVPSPRSWD